MSWCLSGMFQSNVPLHWNSSWTHTARLNEHVFTNSKITIGYYRSLIAAFLVSKSEKMLTLFWKLLQIETKVYIILRFNMKWRNTYKNILFETLKISNWIYTIFIKSSMFWIFLIHMFYLRIGFFEIGLRISHFNR